MNQKGLAPILIVLLIAAALGSYLVYQKQLQPAQYPSIASSVPQSTPISQPSSTPSPISPNLKKSPNLKQKAQASPSPSPSSATSWANDPVTDQATCNDVPPSRAPAFGGAPLKVSFSPSGGVRYTYGTMEGYQWDFDSDGVWDTDIVQNSDSTHTYTKPGTYTATYRVRTSKNTWSKNCIYPHKVVVGESASDQVSVDRNEFETTVKKSDYPGKSFTTFDAFKVSTQDESYVSVKAVKPYSGGFITNAAGTVLRGGSSFQFQLTVELNNPEGEYQNEVKVMYTKSGNETVEGPTIKFKIIIQK